MEIGALRFLAVLFCAGILAAPVWASPEPVKAVVLRSTGTIFLGQTIWNDLNAGWSQFGDTPVQIDWTSLAGYDWTLPEIEATGADVLVLSCPAFWFYTEAEINSVRQYVERGNGLIITYSSFLSADRALAPLVGISESISLATGTSTVPMMLAPLVPQHPVLAGLGEPYVTGVPFSVRYDAGPVWPLDGGTVVADLVKSTGYVRGAGIIAKDGGAYRGLYFSYYVEDKADGANQQDVQVFYNALLWASAPEPGTLCLMIAGVTCLSRRAIAGGRRR